MISKGDAIRRHGSTESNKRSNKMPQNHPKTSKATRGINIYDYKGTPDIESIYGP